MHTTVFQETKGRPRHGHAQVGPFALLPDTAWTTTYVAELMLGKGRSSIDAMRRDGRLQARKRGRTVEILVGSIRREMAA